MVCPLISRSLATSATVRPASSRSSTFRRNSGGYPRRPMPPSQDRVAQESNNSPPEKPGHTTSFLVEDGVMARPSRHPAEVRQRAVRLVAEHRSEYKSEWAAICSIAEKFGV